MSAELAEATTPPATFLVARNPGEMQQAQEHLVVWADTKLKELRADLREMQAEIQSAKEHKWRVSGLSRQASKVRARLSFYEKVHEALAAGYAIIPEFPVSIFAIRVERDTSPSRNESLSRNIPDGIRDQEAGALPAGKGSYASPKAEQGQKREDREDGKGLSWVKITQWAQAFRDVDIPMAMAKPILASALDRAMALKVFDELGICPEARRRNRDPMVVGRIVLREGYDRRRVCFLVAWYLDTRTL